MDWPVDIIPDSLQAVLAFAVAFAVATIATPRLREAAIRLGIVDRPDGRLKSQREPVPYLGGLAVALGVLVSLGITYQFDHQTLATLLGAAIVLVLGLVDDFGALRPWSKLAGQVLAALVLVKAGASIHLVALPRWVAVPLTVFWVVAVTNALNLIDVSDGLSSGVGAVASLFFALIAYREGLMGAAFLGAALAGALLGFRRFNVFPARIYLGDTGSLFAGFILAALAVMDSYTKTHLLGAAVPVLILAVPLFDMTFVVAMRRLRGLPVMQGSPDHFPLRLRRFGLSVRGTARAAMAAAAVFGTMGFASMAASLPAAVTLVSVATVLAIAFAAWLARID